MQNISDLISLLVFVPPVSTKILVRRSGYGFLIEQLQTINLVCTSVSGQSVKKKVLFFLYTVNEKIFHTVLLHFSLLVQEVLVVL